MPLLKSVWKRWTRAIHDPIAFPLTVKHYYSFDNLASDLKDDQLCSPESWDALRLGHPHFLVPKDRDSWLADLKKSKDGQDPAVKQRAAEIAHQLKLRGVADVHSVGIGCAPLEYYLKISAPSVHLTASDYSSASIARLRRVFVECDQIVEFDILKGDWRRIQPDPLRSLVLMYRVDPHLSNDQWTSVFKEMHAVGVQNVLFIPAEILTLHYIALMQKRYWLARFRGVRQQFTGYERTPKVFKRFWQNLYTCEEYHLGGLLSFWLHRSIA